uniref:Uncharacterized protein n=1 Tax=Arundo donax TaxID=35708 RepID=A0A0A9FLI3_ARUDO
MFTMSEAMIHQIEHKYKALDGQCQKILISTIYMQPTLALAQRSGLLSILGELR